MSEDILYQVLNCVRLEGGFDDAEDLVVLALAIRPKDFTASEYKQAVNNCLARGWIKVLSAEDCRVDAARWKDQPHQDMEPYQEGAVDFTRDGWDVYCRLLQVKNGVGIEPLLSQCVHYLWDTPGQLSLIAMSEDAVLEDIAKIQSGEDDPIRNSLDADYRIVQVAGPHPIGPWWVMRHYQAPQAFRADIAYKMTGA